MTTVLPNYSSGEHPIGGTILFVDANGKPLLVTGRTITPTVRPQEVAVVDTNGNQVSNFSVDNGLRALAARTVQLQAALAQQANGFIPIEVPEFLIGV
jgi:hypothetical protein